MAMASASLPASGGGRAFMPAPEGVPEKFKAIEEYLASLQHGGSAPAPAPAPAPAAGPSPAMAGLDSALTRMNTSGAGYQLTGSAALNPALGTRTPPQSMQGLMRARAY